MCVNRSLLCMLALEQYAIFGDCIEDAGKLLLEISKMSVYCVVDMNKTAGMTVGVKIPASILPNLLH